MAVYNIPIHGLIGSPEDPEDKNIYFQYTDLLMHLNNAQAFDTLNLDIASNGGYTSEADKMIEAIKATGKFITSCNSGNVASAASKIFTLAPKGSRMFYPDRGAFLIHNPWAELKGDAAYLIEASKELKKTENEYADWYASATGANREIILAFMETNTPLTPDQIEALGFATISKPILKAVAKLTLNKMADTKELEKKMNGFEVLLNKILAKFKIKNILVNDANGAELEFPELTDPSEIVIGVKVLVSGAPANGDYTLPDGTVYTCENGILTVITPAMPDPNQALTAENVALKAEIAKLKAEKDATEKEKTEAIQALAKVNTEFKTFKTTFSNWNPPAGDPPAGDPPANVNRKPFKTKA